MLIKPLVTEKSMSEAQKGRYTFVVATGMNKTSIKKEVTKLFGVDVIKTQTIAVHGKAYRTGKRWKYAYKPDRKKAIVTLKPGQKIELFDVRAGDAANNPDEQAVQNIETGEKIKTNKKVTR